MIVIVLLVFLLALAFIVACPLYLRLRLFEQQTVISVRVPYLLSFRLYPSKKQKKKDAEQTQQPKKRRSIETIRRQIEWITEILKKATHGAKVTRCKIRAHISGDDPADVALLYGGVNAAVYTLAAYLYAGKNSKKPDINISCDYLDGESTFAADIVLRVHFISLLRGLLFVVMHGIIPVKQEVTE